MQKGNSKNIHVIGSWFILLIYVFISFPKPHVHHDTHEHEHAHTHTSIHEHVTSSSDCHNSIYHGLENKCGHQHHFSETDEDCLSCQILFNSKVATLEFEKENLKIITSKAVSLFHENSSFQISFPSLNPRGPPVFVS